jgi:DTW domain-containing protein YfiP
MRNPANRMGDGVAAHRCLRCRLMRYDCLCALIPRVETRTHVVLVLHQLEDRKTTNTGRLALRCLPNSALVIRGDRGRATETAGVVAADARDDIVDAGQASDASGATAAREPPEPPKPPKPSDTPSWSLHGDPVLLFPHPDAQPIEAFRDRGRPVTLIVPDGTWRQGQRVRHRVPGLGDVPCARVSRVLPSTYRLRTSPDPRRLATLEAIAEALGVLEGDDVRRALLDIFDVMVERSLRSRAGGAAAPALATTTTASTQLLRRILTTDPATF